MLRGATRRTRPSVWSVGLLAVALGCAGHGSEARAVGPSTSSSGVSASRSDPVTAPPSAAPGCGPGPLTVTSAVLDRSVRVTVLSVAPPAAVTAVVYLLHGANTDETQWTAIGAEDALSALASTGTATHMAVVLPDLPSASLEANDAAALVQDVIPAVEACLGGSVDRAHRAVGGISRGGQVALEAASDHADLFAAVGGHSPVVASDDVSTVARRLASSGLHVWLDVGADDGLRDVTSALGAALTDLGSAPRLQVLPGGHDRAYWRAHVQDYLAWYAQQVGG
jgi:enterochelin esterase-like enzyme